MSGNTRKKQKNKRSARHAAKGNARKLRTEPTQASAHCVIRRTESGMLSDLLKPQQSEAQYDTAAIDQKFSSKFSRASTAGSSFSIAAGVAATTMAGILSHLR